MAESVGTSTGSVRIATRMRPDGCLDLSVSDTGCGIDERDLAAVMQPFGQIDNPYNRISQGTGLGLPLARRLVEMHDGRLALESKVGVGTTATSISGASDMRITR